MAGNYLISSSSKRQELIGEWITSTLQNGGIDRFDELHIDRIDPHWRDKDEWVSAALEALLLASDVIHSLRFDISVVSAISLDPDAVDHHGPRFDTYGDLTNCLSWVPPSLYLFNPVNRFWMADDAGEVRAVAIVLPSEEFEYQTLAYTPHQSAEKNMTIYVTHPPHLQTTPNPLTSASM